MKLTYSEHQRMQDARLVLTALGANIEQIDTIAPQAAAAAGPIGNVAARLLQCCSGGTKR
jgi:hypothetical protein